jgi:hypothetical protein
VVKIRSTIPQEASIGRDQRSKPEQRTYISL